MPLRVNDPAVMFWEPENQVAGDRNELLVIGADYKYPDESDGNAIYHTYRAQRIPVAPSTTTTTSISSCSTSTTTTTTNP